MSALYPQNGHGTPIYDDLDEKKEEDKDDQYGYVDLLGSNRSESPLSSQEIYNISYSSKYKESMDFIHIQETFNIYHQFNLSYAQIEDKNPEYRASSLLFFKDLDATLTTIGCIDDDKMRFFIQCRQYILFKMIDQISLIKNQYEYLSLIILITPPLIFELDELRNNNNNNYWTLLNDACFIIKLKYDYNLWCVDSKKCEIEFKNELSGALLLDPIYIKINGIGRGLNDIVIDLNINSIWIPYYIQGVQTDIIKREYMIRPQDQIEVKYKKQWIASTILQVQDTMNRKGKKIKIRYNKLNGINDRFKTKNTEWIWTIKEYDRLRLTDKVYIIISYNGVKIGTIFKPPLLAQCRNGNKQYIDIGHHIFVKRNNVWYRCQVIKSVLDGKKIKILYLVNTFVKNTEWLRLWEKNDLQRISLYDMRK